MGGRLEGTRTRKNLKEAFARESMARNKYTFFAGEAPKACPVCAHPKSYFRPLLEGEA